MLNIQVTPANTAFAVTLTNTSGVSIIVTDEQTEHLRDSLRLPTSSLLQCIRNLLSMQERTTSYACFQETETAGVIYLCAEDEELFDSYNLALKVLSTIETLQNFLETL